MWKSVPLLFLIVQKFVSITYIHFLLVYVRFTEFFVDELDSDADLRLLARTYLSGLCNVPVKGIVDFYQQVRKTASTSLFDGTGRRPHYRSEVLSVIDISTHVQLVDLT